MPSWLGVRTACYCSPHGPHSYCRDGAGCRWCYCLAGMKVLALYLVFSDTNPFKGLRGLGCLITAWRGWQSRSLLVWVWMWAWPQCFLWCLAEVQQFLSKSFLCCQANLFLVLYSRKSNLSLGLLFVCTHWCFWVGY